MQDKTVNESRNEIISAMEDSDDVLSVVHEVVKDKVTEIFEDQVFTTGDSFANIISSIARGALLGVNEVDTSMLVEASYQVVDAVLEAVSEAGGDVQLASGEALAGLVQASIDIGGDTADIAVGGVESAMECAAELDLDATDLAKSAMFGAVTAGDSADAMVGESIRESFLESEMIPKSLVNLILSDHEER